MWIGGQKQISNISKIRFKVIVFKNNQMRKRDLHAEIQKEADGSFKAQQITFRFINHKDGNDIQEEHFKRSSNTRDFELSFLDNRIIKMQIYDTNARNFIEYTIVFANVHKKHQFAELYNLEELNLRKLAKVPSVLPENLQTAIIDPSKSSQEEQDGLKFALENQSKIANLRNEYQADDFKILCTTWNMGQKGHSVFKDSPDAVFENVGQYQLIVVCVQECKKKFKHERLRELETFFGSRGFLNVDKTFISMWEMWLVCYIRSDMKHDVTKIRSGSIAKGVGKMIGNKGGVAQSFMVKNRLFNFIAVHLKHGQNKSEKRDEMASQLIKELKLQQFQQNIGGLELDHMAEFCFFLGDLNYRLETTFADLNNTNVKEQAILMVPTKDQLKISMSQGNYPNY